MNEKVVDLGHEVIDAAIIVVPNPQEKVIDSFLQGVFEVRSKASSLRANRPQGARIRIKTNETGGSHQKVPVGVISATDEYADGVIFVMNGARRFELVEHLSNGELDQAIDAAQKADETCLVRRLCFVSLRRTNAATSWGSRWRLPTNE